MKSGRGDGGEPSWLSSGFIRNLANKKRTHALHAGKLRSLSEMGVWSGALRKSASLCKELFAVRILSRREVFLLLSSRNSGSNLQYRRD